VVERVNIVIYGAGYTIQGPGIQEIGHCGIQISNPDSVTVTNVMVQGFDYGIAVFGYSGNKIDRMFITGNNLTSNYIGIRFSSYSNYVNNTIAGNRISANHYGIHIAMGQPVDAGSNQIIGNQIANNDVGMYFLMMGDWYSPEPSLFYMNNSIYDNNFINNSQNVVNGYIVFDHGITNFWDDGANGNYWSDYNGTDADGDGIGDTPYIIDKNNQDNYPLMNTVDITEIPEFPSWIILPLLFAVATLLVGVIKKELLHSTA
jgi:nitrous oxidase accessory protein